MNMPRPTAREIVMETAAKYSWKLVSFANTDSYAHNGIVINIDWNESGRGCKGCHIQDGDEPRHSDYSPVCIVHARQWMKLYGELAAPVDHAVGN